MHDRESIRRLQHAHADWIEASDRRAAERPGNPQGIEIVRVGDTRVFLSNTNRLENRAIFTGNETAEQFEQVTDLFDRKGVVSYFEINPTNFFRTEPFKWNSEVVPNLLQLGCQPDLLRCVWRLDGIDQLRHAEEPDGCVRRYTHDQADDFADARLVVQPPREGQAQAERESIVHAFTDRWRHYIGFEQGEPVSTSTLFVNDSVGYLAWGFTRKSFRRRGHHRRHVIRRALDAFEWGCKLVFTVTDFNIPSSLSVQKCGFALAYNYLLLERQPIKVEAIA